MDRIVHRAIGRAPGGRMDPTRTISGARMASRWPNARTPRAQRPATSLFAFTTRDHETGDVLPGAVFTLTAPDHACARCTSDCAGVARFTVWPGIRYLLCEVQPAPGYAPGGTLYEILIGFNGRLFVDGAYADNFSVPSRRLPGFGAFTARAIDEGTGQPRPGAAFALCLAGQEIAAATASEVGEVTFCGLAPGSYCLREIPPCECEPPLDPLPVTVAQNGAVCIAGQPADGYPLTDPRSQPDQ